MDLLDKIREDLREGKPQEFFMERPYLGTYNRRSDPTEEIDAEINAMTNVELIQAIMWAWHPNRLDPADPPIT